jgi:hypothetical protein
VHVDGFNWFIDNRGGKPFVPIITPSTPDILTPASIKTMTTKTTAKDKDGKDPNYAKGWAVNTLGNWWHVGRLPGTTSILVRTSQGFCWAALANTGPDDALTEALDNVMWQVFGDVSQWPTHDLFPRYDTPWWWQFLWNRLASGFKQ